MISVVSWNIKVKKCVVRCCSNYHGEITVPAVSFPRKQDLKSERIRFVKDGRQVLYLLFTSVTLKKSFFKNGKKIKKADW